MFSDSEDEILFDNAALRGLIVMGGLNRTCSVHPINKSRKRFGQYHTLFFELKQHPDRFFEYLRMDIATFNYILEKVSPCLQMNWTNYNKQPIGPEERLVITLRYCATGESFKSLSFTFRMGATTVGSIVKETVNAVWNILQPIHLPVPTQDDFIKISEDYMKIWNFPNCLGALDGKHVKIKCPSHSGSMFFNYKKFFSIVLQAVCDANYRFTVIEVRGYGRQSDGGTFQSSAFSKLLSKKQLNVPTEQSLPHTQIRMPFVFIADEAYPLQENLLKPYSRQTLNPERQYFNQRLSRARKTIECSFDIIYAKWRILSKAIETNEQLADITIKANCLLHNIIMDKEGFEQWRGV
ncbi:uncharacterized protein LOC126733542 [Anthonomus grandis grandis]|uniref:uncharacterized protein LOC126733542 n=1 Tax=Anthonomus grandis grandis TaxID=2921223 RepID=UPI0021653161|nr:uncharacterized protein LOC126733542 [Anthonomus grandis grandis]